MIVGKGIERTPSGCEHIDIETRHSQAVTMYRLMIST